MRFARLVGISALGLLAPGLGCTVYDPSLVSACMDCKHAPPPPAPTGLLDVADAPVFAMRNIVINQQDSGAWEDIGLDLDNVYTKVGGRHACEPNPNAVNWAGESTAQIQADGNGGIDNVFGAQFYNLVAVQVQFVASIDPESAARAAHDAGDGTMIARLSNWNGTLNDEQVTVTIVQAVDGTPLPRDQVFLDATTHTLKLVSNPTQDAPPPAWDPATPDNWWVREDGFVGGDPTQPLQEDANGYITNGVIVHRLAPQPIFFRMGADHAIKVIYRDATVQATMSADFKSLTNITVAGRWSILDLLQTASGVELCSGDAALTLLRENGYIWADVASSAGDDGSGAPCDALSMAVTFETAYAGDWTPSAETVAPGVPIPDYCAGGA